MELGSTGLKRGYSWKFYAGAALVILSMIIGVIAKFLIFVYISNPFWFWFNVAIYIVSWPILILGGWWVGKEYADKIRRYASYKFYQEELKKGTTKMYHLTKEKTNKLREGTRLRSNQIKERAKNQTERVRKSVKHQISKVKTHYPFRKKK